MNCVRWLAWLNWESLTQTALGRGFNLTSRQSGLALDGKAVDASGGGLAGDVAQLDKDGRNWLGTWIHHG